MTAHSFCLDIGGVSRRCLGCPSYGRRCLDMVGHPPVGGVHGHVQARVRPPTLAVSSLGLNILAVPGVTKEQARTAALVKAEFDGEVAEVRAVRPEGTP